MLKLSDRRNPHTPDEYTPGYLPLEPFGYWPDEYEYCSRQEGWILTNDSDDCVTISRVDCPEDVDECPFDEPCFAGDAEAQTFVIRQAASGSAPHLLALFLMGNPIECRLNMDPPDCLLHPELLRKKRQERGEKS